MHPTIGILTKRVSHVTGLRTDTFLDESELLQVRKFSHTWYLGTWYLVLFWGVGPGEGSNVLYIIAQNFPLSCPPNYLKLVSNIVQESVHNIVQKLSTKLSYKVPSKLSMKLFTKLLMKLSSKLFSKLSFKLSSKLSSKLLYKLSMKLFTKLTTKMSQKLSPINSLAPLKKVFQMPFH